MYSNSASNGSCRMGTRQPEAVATASSQHRQHGHLTTTTTQITITQITTTQITITQITTTQIRITQITTTLRR